MTECKIGDFLNRLLKLEDLLFSELERMSFLGFSTEGGIVLENRFFADLVEIVLFWGVPADTFIVDQEEFTVRVKTFEVK